jgi:hypothetical protein
MEVLQQQKPFSAADFWPLRLFRVVKDLVAVIEYEEYAGEHEIVEIATSIQACVQDADFQAKYFLLTPLCTECGVLVAKRAYWKGTPDAPFLCLDCDYLFRRKTIEYDNFSNHPTGLGLVTLATLRKVANRPNGNASLAKKMGGIRFYGNYYLKDVQAWAAKNPCGLPVPKTRERK